MNKFNVVLRLLKRVTDSSRLVGVNKDNQTLLHVLAIKTKAGAHEDLQLQVCVSLSLSLSLSLIEEQYEIPADVHTVVYGMFK